MSFADLLNVFPGSPVASALLWVVVLIGLLYLARPSAHRLVRSLGEVVHHAMRLAARSVMLAEARLLRRNREVLLAAGREAAERVVSREFERIEAAVRRDLAEYPALERKLREALSQIEDEYRESSGVPQEVPGWAAAVEAIAAIPTPRDPALVEVLENIHKSMVKAHERALKAQQKESRERHQALRRMLPRWRRVQKTLDESDARVNALLDRSVSIDRHMDHFDDISRGTDRAAELLSSSSLTQFFVAAFVLGIAVFGAGVNFHLIARPMQEMVGGNAELWGFRTSDIAALVIILVETTMGVFLMESLRVTRLFPVIGALDDKLRVRMIWAATILLFAMASIEAGLAYMRELLAQDDAALVAGLLAESGGASAAAGGTSRWITTAAQMGLGFILPFALTFVAIPLESFISSSRTVLGAAMVGLLRLLAFLLRLVGNLFRYLGGAVVNAYDLVIFLPLWIERKVKDRQSAPENEVADEAHLAASEG